jgi:hypothetical protein
MLIIIFSCLLSIFATAVMGYISMAMPIGPWIAPTIVLLALLCTNLFRLTVRNAHIALITVASSIGGILATGFGFSLPALYFIDPDLFTQWMQSPAYFCFLLTVLALAAGACSFCIAELLEEKLLVEEKLEFPVGHLVATMIAAGNQLRKAYELLVGFAGATLFVILQDGIGAWRGFIPKSLVLLSTIRVGAVVTPPVVFDLWPLLWAIGFVTGHLIAMPLAIGALAKPFIVDPINRLFFASVPDVQFMFVFCSGMVLFSSLTSFLGLKKSIKQLYQWIKNWQNAPASSRFTLRAGLSGVQTVEMSVLVFSALLLLKFFGFTVLQELYLVLFTAFFTYQMVVIAGKWGIAPLGRFATFVMVPAMLLFNLSFTQIVVIATFVEVCGGVAVDLLVGRKIGQLIKVDRAAIKRYQYLGLLISALSIGVVFWLLITACSLGSAELFAYKAQSRHLLINGLVRGTAFNWMVLLVGAAFSFLLSWVKVNPMLVMGGLLMPLNLSLGLIFGGLLALVLKNRQEWEPFWSGVFAANSLWMIVRALF